MRGNLFINNNEKRQVKNFNEFKIFFQYINEEDSMVIGGQNIKYKRAWVIPQSMAWKYADSVSGEPTKYLIESAIKMREFFGLTGKDVVFKIASAIVDSIPDLIELKPSEYLL